MTTIRLTILALAALTALSSLCACAQSTVTVEVRPVADPPETRMLLLIDGKLAEIENMEVARGQQVMVWLREFEKLGWGTVVAGDSPEKSVLKTKTIALTFSKGQSIAMVNSLAVQLPIDTYLKDGKLMVPMGFVAKSLGYNFEMSNRPVATVSTLPPQPPAKANTIRGQVRYNGKGIEGISVALVDPDYNTIKGFQATTGNSGDYVFENVPDGKYLAYVWVGHNPNYFNRVSEQTDISAGKTAHLKAIELGRIVRPIRPRVDEVIGDVDKIVFEWTPCPGAESYSLVVTKQVVVDAEPAPGTARPSPPTPLVSLTTTKPIAEVTKKLPPGVTYLVDIEARSSEGRFLGGTVGSGGKIWTFSVSR